MQGNLEQNCLKKKSNCSLGDAEPIKLSGCQLAASGSHHGATSISKESVNFCKPKDYDCCIINIPPGRKVNSGKEQDIKQPSITQMKLTACVEMCACKIFHSKFGEVGELNCSINSTGTPQPFIQETNVGGRKDLLVTGRGRSNK